MRLRIGRVLDALANGETANLRACRLRAEEAHDRSPVLITCMTHNRNHNQSQPCLLSTRSRLRRCLDARLIDLLADSNLTPRLRGLALAELVHSPDPSSRLLVAQHAGAPAKLLALLVHDWWWEVRAGLANNQACPPRVHYTLIFDPNPWVRRAMAEAATTTSDMIAILAADDDFGVKDAAAEHPRCPHDTQISLATDERFEIRRSIAKRRDAPRAALQLLAADPEVWIRLFVATNPATPRDVRELLSTDPDPRVRSAARHATSSLARIANALASGAPQSR